VSISLAVVAHTNVGKTTLVRTLLKRDIGEVADRPHVTEDAERHTLLDAPGGDVLYLWDTPGFGDSVRLLKRLRNSGNPLGWLQTQVWDRFADRPFFCSQRAIAAVRDAADVVLYLVNAAEDPAAAAYIEAELQILQWVGKPVLLLLNQSGPPRPRQAEADEEARWNRRLAQYVGSGSVVTLDAFARCWVQEDQLLRAAATLIDPQKRPELSRLREAWRGRNLETFGASMHEVASRLAETAADREAMPEAREAVAIARRVGRWIGRPREGAQPEPAAQAAMETLGKRLEARTREEIDRLIGLHGLSGRARVEIVARTAEQFAVARPADVAGTSLLGGLMSGAAGGLAADLSAGGLTLGAGMLVGAILGALGAGGAARAYNVMQGQQEGLVRWSPELLAAQAQTALLRYLTVAHFGRGRGDWIEGEAPAHWRPLVEEVVLARVPALRLAWALVESGAAAAAIAERLEPELREATREALVRLYPESGGIFEAREASSPGP